MIIAEPLRWLSAFEASRFLTIVRHAGNVETRGRELLGAHSQGLGDQAELGLNVLHVARAHAQKLFLRI